VSRLVPRKGIQEVIEAVADLPGLELLVAGGPPAAMLFEDDHARHLAQVIDDLGVADRVQLLGAVERPHVPELMRSAAAVCCTPWYEPFGMTALEAMACGTPVVASRVGGLAETVVDGRTGILVPPRQPRSIRAAIEALLNDQPRRRAMERSAVRRAAAYAWPSIAERTMHVAEQLRGRRRVGSGEHPLAVFGRPSLTGGGS
jgi:glycosyltransferase involved in cell wall biosynthesis